MRVEAESRAQGGRVAGGSPTPGQEMYHRGTFRYYPQSVQPLAAPGSGARRCLRVVPGKDNGCWRGNSQRGPGVTIGTIATDNMVYKQGYTKFSAREARGGLLSDRPRAKQRRAIMNKFRFLKASLPGAAIALASLAFAAVLVTDAIADGLEVVADKGVKHAKLEAFLVTLDGGEEKTIAFAGPFEVFARCILGVESTSRDEILIKVTSSEPGWWEDDGGPFAAGVERNVLTLSNDFGVPTYSEDTRDFSAIGPDAGGKLFYVAIEGNTVGLGLNIFGHKCIAVGVISIIEEKEEH